MAEIDTYSPRKVTDQNRDRLPSDHDSKKRITYVNITLNEEEIAEAIRNWIRAQVPIPAKAEMPVEMIAGRSGNGHSANVTIPMLPVAVASPEQPTEPMQEFTAAAADAHRRNGEDNAQQETPSAEAPVGPGTNETVAENEVIEQEAPQVEETAPAEPEAVTETEEVAEPTPAPTEEEPPKKSSLFDAPAATSPLPAPDDAAAAATSPEAASDTPAETPAEDALAPSKVKSIFDA